MKRNQSRFITWWLLVGGMVVSSGCSPTLDHFWVHEVDPHSGFSYVVQLSDQFDVTLKDARVISLNFLANPTRKIHGGTSVGIGDPNAHLTWYGIDQPAPEPRRTIRFRNQFGQHSVDVQDPKFLLVPTQKTSDDNSEFPESLDHFKCYEVIEVNTAPSLPVVTLEDQFGTRPGLQVRQPRYVCTPVRKVRAGEPPHGIKNTKKHLAVYDLPAIDEDMQAATKDQFDEYGLMVRRSVMVAVPSEIQAVVAH